MNPKRSFIDQPIIQCDGGIYTACVTDFFDPEVLPAQKPTKHLILWVMTCTLFSGNILLYVRERIQTGGTPQEKRCRRECASAQKCPRKVHAARCSHGARSMIPDRTHPEWQPRRNIRLGSTVSTRMLLHPSSARPVSDQNQVMGRTATCALRWGQAFTVACSNRGCCRMHTSKTTPPHRRMPSPTRRQLPDRSTTLSRSSKPRAVLHYETMA